MKKFAALMIALRVALKSLGIPIAADLRINVAFFINALGAMGLRGYEFVSYSEHAVSTGADSQAVSYIQLRHQGEMVFGVGMDHNISIASIKGILCAINRSVTAQEER